MQSLSPKEKRTYMLAAAAVVVMLGIFANNRRRRRAPPKPRFPTQEDDYRMIGVQQSVQMRDSFLKIKERCPYKVILSLTSSPQRLSNVFTILPLFDSRSYDEIHLNLPRHYGRTGEGYNVHEHMKTYPKLKIFTQDTDTGPQMKLVPTLNRCQERTIVITIDDDTTYNKSMIYTLLHALEIINYQGVVGFHGQTNKQLFNFTNRAASDKAHQLFPNLKAAFPDTKIVDIIEGFGMIAYVSDLVDTKRIEEAARTSKECFRSDDLTISFALETKGVPRFALQRVDPYPGIMQMSVGFRSDALWQQQEHPIAYNVCMKQMGAM